MTSVKTSKKGFTLVELVVVIAILAILAAIAIPVVNSIINTASKNGALSNAQSIELAIKEAQADIASKNTEVYNGGTKNDAEGTGVTIPNAKSKHGEITVYHVAVAKGIEDAFDQVTYNGTNYYPFWDNNAGKCIFIGVEGDNEDKTLDGEDKPASGLEQLSDKEGGSGKYHICEVKVDDIKTEAVVSGD